MANGQPTPQQVMNFLIQSGFTPVQAAGITGNLAVESSNFHPSVLSGRVKGDNGTAFGIMQWRGGRQTNFFKFANELNRDPYDWRTQLLFLKEEMNPASTYADGNSIAAYRKLQTARNPYEATAAFARAEMPQGYSDANPQNTIHFDRRYSAARQAFGLGGVGGMQGMSFNQDGSINRNNQMGHSSYDPLSRNQFGQIQDDFNDYGSFMDDYNPNSPMSTQQKSAFNPLSYSDFNSSSPYNLSLGNNNLNSWGRNSNDMWGGFNTFSELGATRGNRYGDY